MKDLEAARGRMAMIVIAIAMGVFGVGAILSAYGVLRREIRRNYVETNPASAFIAVHSGHQSRFHPLGSHCSLHLSRQVLEVLRQPLAGRRVTGSVRRFRRVYYQGNVHL